MTRRDIPSALFLAIAVVFAARGCGASAELAVAEAARVWADSVLEATRDSLVALAEATTEAQRADSIEHTALLDSVAAARLREAEATERATEAVERAERARARASEAAATLAETLDTAQAVLFAAHLAEDDSVTSALTDRAEAAESRADAVETENAALWRRMATADDLIASLSAERDGERARADAAESALRASDEVNRALRRQGNVWKLVAAAELVVIVLGPLRG